ncbi:hypothetical protein RIR_jg39095.t7 [Rhizophagus irregularis DAOM 181602=DAOM 197198]|nr:hypothetical protein RIR_jg39095.t7 [Rhizophagus irregularis DAOM 181602=DAOM 197198]
MAPAHAAMDQAITKRSLSSSMISIILPIVSASTQLSMCRSSQFSLHLLFPADAKLNDEAKSLFVTDIPLFLNETQVRQAFSRYGTVIKCKLTPRNIIIMVISNFPLRMQLLNSTTSGRSFA